MDAAADGHKLWIELAILEATRVLYASTRALVNGESEERDSEPNDEQHVELPELAIPTQAEGEAEATLR